MSVKMDQCKHRVKIGILIVAYRAENSILDVLKRIPKPTWDQIDEVFIFDDASNDSTKDFAVAYAGYGSEKVVVYYNEVNLGYGGNQKRGIRYAIERGFDIVTLLHGDGQYAPECLANMFEPLVAGRAQAVFGSRMMTKGAALRGGMPLYKFVGNKILTTFQNLMLPQYLTEYHSGYRAYDVHALHRLPFPENTNDFHFDTEIIIQLMEANMKIEEVAIPTYYGDEICHVDGMRYAWDVFKATIRYGLHKKGFIYDPRYDMDLGEKYTFKKNRFSSHQQIIGLLDTQFGEQGSQVLDVGCGSGALALKMVEKGYRVVGMDTYDNEMARARCEEFFVADADDGLEILGERIFSHVVFADILEHVKDPEKLLLQTRRKLEKGGSLIASTGNIAHLFIRLNLMLGRFEYAERGILDRTHVRHFTTKSFKRLFSRCGYSVTKVIYMPIPFEQIISNKPRLTDCLSWLNMIFVKLWPSMFAYQTIVEAIPSDLHPTDILRQEHILRSYNSYESERL